MTKYSNDKILFSAVVKAFSPIIYYYIDNAILRGASVHYAEESPYKIIDAHFNEVNQNLTFVFHENVVKTIDLNVFKIRQSESVPSKFYFVNKENNEDCFAVNFK